MDTTGAEAVFRASGGVDDHMIPGLAGDSRGIKIVNLLPGAELNVYHLYFRGRLGHIDNFFFHW